MNPAKLMKLKGYWTGFAQRHPKFVRYLKVVADGRIQEDAVLDITVKSPDGTELHTNMRVTAEDVALFGELKELFGTEK